MKNIRKYSRLSSALAFCVAAASTMWSCSSDNTPVHEPDPSPIVFGAPSSASFTFGGGAVESRAESSPGEDPIAFETLGVFGVSQSGTKVFNGDDVFYYIGSQLYATEKTNISAYWPLSFGESWPAGNSWPYANIKYWSGFNHQFYCYSPHQSKAASSKISLMSNDYGSMRSFTYSNIPPFSNVPYMVADGYKYASSGTVTFPMKHLSARICVRLKIGEEYAKMRRIFIKKVSVVDRDKGAKTYNCIVTFNDDDTPATIEVNDQGEVYSPSTTGAKIDLIPIFNNDDGLELSPTEWKQFGSLYVMHGQEIPSITINVVYDVYDLVKNTPVRQNQQVANTISLFKSVERGKYYNINIMVSPAYLYVLSDNDVKPDILISPESGSE